MGLSDNNASRATGAAAGNRILAASTADLSASVGAGLGAGFPADSLLVWPEGTQTDSAELLDRFARSPRLGLVVLHPDGPDEPLATPDRIDAGFRAMRRSLHDGDGEGERDDRRPPTVATRTAALIEIGGFDPSFPGYGWADVVHRLRLGGWAVAGAGEAGQPTVLDGLSVQDRFATEARWYQLHHPERAERFRRLVIAAAVSIPGDATAKAVLTDARRRWRGPAPHVAQVGVGYRADWRFLLPDGGRAHTLIATAERPDPSRWDWLVDDGWTERISFTANPADPADVVFVGRGANLAEAASAASPAAAIIVEQERGFRGASSASHLESVGFGPAARYIVTPSLARPRRFTPADHGPSVAWLMADAASSILPDAIVPSSLSPEAGPVASASAGRSQSALAAALTRALPSVLIATRADTGTRPAIVPVSTAGTTVLTSGHDEGSRAVLLAFEGEAREPSHVIKVSSRPAYNSNVIAEVERVASLQALLDAHGGNPKLLPTTTGPVAVGNLVASTESFGGHLTASDRCYRFPAERDTVLNQALDTIDGFTATTLWETLAWSDDLFDRFVASLYERYAALVGPSPNVEALLTDLAERSDTLAGVAMALARGHHDLGPWNVMWRPDGMTIVDWELAAPRTEDQRTLAGSDQLYFAKYWLHIALGTESVADECAAFSFLADRDRTPTDPRLMAADRVEASLDTLRVDRRFVPIITTHVWLESALYTMERRSSGESGDGVDVIPQPGTARDYLETLARYRVSFLAFWS